MRLDHGAPGESVHLPGEGPWSVDRCPWNGHERQAGRTRLVCGIAVGPGQKARVEITLQPKKARKTAKVKKTTRRLIVRTKEGPKKLRKRTRIQVPITARGPGFTRTKWVRTWRVR